MPDYVIRRASVDDVAIIARHRVAMFRDMGQLMGQVPTDALAAELLELSTPALAAALRDGSYVGWLAVDATGEIRRRRRRAHQAATATPRARPRDDRDRAGPAGGERLQRAGLAAARTGAR